MIEKTGTGHDLSASIARVAATFSDGEQRHGTAFLVAPGLALTAFHIVGRQQKAAVSLAAEVRLFFGPEETEARPLSGHLDPHHDWALLDCESLALRPILPLGELQDRALVPGELIWSTFGFPKSNPFDGLTIAGTVRSLVASVRGATAYQLFAEEAAAGSGAPMSGLSGSPVVVDGVAVALVRYGLTDEAQRIRAGTLYACPMAPVLESCGRLLPRPDPYWGLPGLPHRPLPSPPFRYLRWYSQAEAAVFFGRGDVIRELYDYSTKAGENFVLLFYGQAGAGKSSVLSAGLEPRLAWHHDVLYCRRRPDATLLETVLKVTVEDGEQEANLVDAWRRREEQNRRPLVVILDQVEEAFIPSLTAGQRELEELAGAMAKMPRHPRDCCGRLVLSFRKEWLPEVESILQTSSVPFSKTFLRPLGQSAIQEVVKGLKSTDGLRRFYNCRVDSDLPTIIASALASDEDSPIAPTLQVLLTKMWDRAKAIDGDAPHWTKSLYREIAEEGTHLDDFLGEKIESFIQVFPKAGAAGLHLDVLDFFTSPLSTAKNRTAEEFEKAYDHIDASVAEVRRFLVDSFLLTAPKTGPDGALRLAHDTLGPLVRRRFDSSIRTAQIARRILSTKALSGTMAAARITSSELRLIEHALDHMRKVSSPGQALIDSGQRQRRRVRTSLVTMLLIGAISIGVFLFYGSTVRHAIHRLSITNTWDRAAQDANIQRRLGQRHAQALYCAWFQPYAAGLMIMPTSVISGSPEETDIGGSFFLLGKQSVGGEAKKWLRVPGDGIEGISDQSLFKRALELGRAKLSQIGYDLPFPKLFERDDEVTLSLFEQRAIRGGFAHVIAQLNVDLAFGAPSTEGDGDYNTECSTSLLIVEYEKALVLSGAPNGDCRETQNHYILFDTGDWIRLRRAPFFPDVFRGQCTDL